MEADEAENFRCLSHLFCLAKLFFADSGSSQIFVTRIIKFVWFGIFKKKIISFFIRQEMFKGRFIQCLFMSW